MPGAGFDHNQAFGSMPDSGVTPLLPGRKVFQTKLDKKEKTR